MRILCFVTDKPENLSRVALKCATLDIHLVVVDLGLPYYPKFPRGLRLTWTYLEGDHPTLVKAAKLGVDSSPQGSVVLLNDRTIDLLEKVDLLFHAETTFPKLASLSFSTTGHPGLQSVVNNPLFGTLYTQRVLELFAFINPQINEINVAALNWAKAVTQKGWSHQRIFTSQTLIEEPIVFNSPTQLHESNDWTVPKLDPTSWRGQERKKPWHFPLTIAIPHWGTTLNLIQTSLASWEAQNLKPYLQIWDTGSPLSYHTDLQNLSAPNLEINFLRSNAWRNPWEGVQKAWEFAYQSVSTKHLLITHNDLIPNSPNLLRELLSLCDEQTPIVGYSDKNNSKAIGCLFTLLNIPVLRSLDIHFTTSWLKENYPSLKTEDPLAPFQNSLKRAQIEPLIIGHDEGKNTTIHFEHFGGLTQYLLTGQALETKEREMQDFIRKSENRIASWNPL